EAPLPPPVHRLPAAGRGAGDHPPQGSRDLRSAGSHRRHSGPANPHPRAEEGAVGVGEPRLGPLARHLERRRPRSGAGRVHADDAGQARAGPRSREGRSRQGSGRPELVAAAVVDWEKLTEFRELWFPCPRIRLPELGPSGPTFIEGGRCISGALGEYTKLWISAGARWHFYYIHPTPRDFFRITMPEAVPHL